MPSKPETFLVKQLMRELTRMGAYAVKNHGNQFSGRGHPDITACLHGRYLGIEAKMPGGKATPLQLYNIERIRQAGGIAAVVHSVEELREVLHGSLHGSSKTGRPDTRAP